MKIFSWNMLYRNKELDRAFEFVSSADFDIFCLQEVPESFLARLTQLPYAIAYRSERELSLPTGTVRNFLVILARHEIVSHGEIPLPDYWSILPLRTRLFVRLMPSRFFTRIRDRAALYADIVLAGTRVRVCNLHLILGRPQWRLEEFDTAMQERREHAPMIVCGDFNVIESPRVSLLNWMLSGGLRDAFFWRRERKHMEERFVKHGLANALRGKVTHPLSNSQLDHILLSPHFSLTEAGVISDRYGSDHHPIFAEVA